MEFSTLSLDDQQILIMARKLPFVLLEAARAERLKELGLIAGHSTGWKLTDAGEKVISGHYLAESKTYR